ncbi:MAG: hypothetical protein JXA67_12045, partial [Micromonosporaceae bacterium]|nr:hypothetical protein [Micromonosporaceae bacterium]
GHPLARHADRLTARPPTPEEIGFFATPAGGSLLVLTRISRSKVNAPAIRILDTVYHADLHELVYDPVRCVGAG